MRARVLASLATALLLSAGSAAAADAIYKYVDANGRMVYTDDASKAPGAAERVDPALVSVVPGPVPSASTTASRQLVAAAERRAAALDQARSDMVVASRSLERAEEQRELGVEPLEGERIGRRFRDEYWQRQAALEAQVQSAQARLDDAIARRNELR